MSCCSNSGDFSKLSFLNESLGFFINQFLKLCARGAKKKDREGAYRLFILFRRFGSLNDDDEAWPRLID